MVKKLHLRERWKSMGVCGQLIKSEKRNINSGVIILFSYTLPIKHTMKCNAIWYPPETFKNSLNKKRERDDKLFKMPKSVS